MSGMGNYHGYFGFRTFSHERAVLRQGRLDLIRVFYPPYTPRVRKLIGFLIKYL
jgi:aldehyde dehydrogenase (NAD+)